MAWSTLLTTIFLGKLHLEGEGQENKGCEWKLLRQYKKTISRHTLYVEMAFSIESSDSKKFILEILGQSYLFCYLFKC